MIEVVFFLNFLFSVFADLISLNLNQCKITHKGTEYLGKTSRTETGITCQYWSSAKLKGPEFLRDEAFPEGSKLFSKNYCRNPNLNPKGPWCYTTKKMLIFDTCDVPLCKSTDCRVTGPGMEYAGVIEKSVSGKKCKKWTEQHKLKAHHKELSFKNRFFSDGSIGEAGRKCRNPDGSVSGPWCYVGLDGSDFHVKELCDIPFCDNIGNLMYSEGTDSGQYFFFSSINESQSLNISFRLWNPENWLHGEILLYLGVYDIASMREDIERWSSGIVIKLSHNSSGILFKNEDTLKKTPLILSGATWTDLTIAWTSDYNQSLIIQLFQKFNNESIALSKTLLPNTVFEAESFRYISLGGSPAFWNIHSSKEDCPVHTVTQNKVTRFWLIKKSILGKGIEIFIRAKKNADIIMRQAPMNDTNQVQVTFIDENKIKIFTCNDKNQTQLLAESPWSNVLNFWKWENFKITLHQDKLQLLWIREALTILLAKTTHENIEKVMWVTFRSPRVSYWAIYCDPRGVSDPPPAAPPECVSQEAEPFNGTMSITSSGRQCLPWTDKATLPEKYRNDELFKPYGGVAKCENFCRNLDSDPKGAFCIVRNFNSESGFGLEHCHPRSCRLTDCKLAGTGNDYIGQLNFTRSKRSCKVWTEVTDSVVDIQNFPDPTLKDAGNFCRNPSKSAVGTWCFTSDSEVPRDVCYIKDCDKPLECTALSTGYVDGNFVYIAPRWRKNGLRFALKAWNPDIYEGLCISLFSMDGSKQYRILIGDEENEKLKLIYKDGSSENLLLQKTLPHLIPTGKWKSYWLRPGHGKIELGYEGVPIPFFEWRSSGKEMSFKPMLINFGTLHNHWIGINFQCSECLTTKTCSQEGYKIYPINIWREDTSVSKLRVNLRGTGSAFVTLVWTPEFQKVLALQIVANTTSIFIVRFVKHEKEVLGTFSVSYILTQHEWSEYIISFTESSIVVHKGTVQLLEWMSPFPLLIYWFAITAEGGAITWTANCPPPDIDGEPRDGSWGRWGSWSCSVTCGKGRGIIERKCDDPPPNVFGDDCKGSPTYEGPCNDFPCGKISPDTYNFIRQYLSSQHQSLQVDVAERVVLRCNSKAISLITSEVSELNITWTHNGFPYRRTRFHMDENYSLVIPRAQEKHSGIYLCMAYQDPDSVPSKVVLDVISLVVIKQKPTKKIRKGKSLTLKCNGLALSYVYADLSQRWELNGAVWKDYGLGTLQAFTVDKLENISDAHVGIWTCVIIQEDFKFKWTTNWIYLKVKSAPSFWSHLMEDMATAPLFGKLGNERNAMILFFVLIGVAFGTILLVIILSVKCLKKIISE